MSSVRRIRGRDPEQLLSVIDELFRVNAKGQLTSAAINAPEALETAEVLLLAELEFDARLSETDRRRLIGRAIRATKKSGPLNAERLWASIHREAEQAANEEPQRFTVVSSISAQFPNELTRRSVGPSRLTFTRELPRRFKEEHQRVTEEQWTVNETKTPAAYTALRISLHALTADSAVEAGLEHVNFLRGIWNWLRNRTTVRIGRDELLPQNDFVLGPFHTVHHRNGSAAVERMWYEDYALTLLPRILPSVDWERLFDIEHDVRSMVRESPHHSLLRRVFVKYAQALDSFDADKAFMRLWSLLEMLSAVERTDSTRVVVKRAAFPYSKGPNREILEALAEIRNETVHEAVNSEYTGARLKPLRRIVDGMIAVWLNPCSELDTLAEVRALLDLRFEDAERLQTQISEHRRLLEILETL